MKFLITSMNYSPEITGIGKYSGEMASWFAENGHEVRVVCAPPYYPDWKVHKDYSPFKYNTELLDGVTVQRCPVWVPKIPKGSYRVIHLLSFAISSFPIIIKNIFWKPDIVIVVVPSFFTIPASLVLAKLSNSISSIHIQDFEIDAAFDLGILRGTLVKSIIGNVESYLYKRFNLVSTISDKMKEKVINKGVDASKCLLFPNWFNITNLNPNDRPMHFRQLLNIPADGIVLLYSGNMGAKQGLEILAQSAAMLKKSKTIYFILCGNGQFRNTLVSETKNLNNVRFLDLQPIEKFHDLLLTADIHLLPQKENVADLVMPSKLCGILASGRPVIASVKENTEIANVLKGNGLITAPENAVEFSNAILQLAENASARIKMGENARKYFEQNLNKDMVLHNYKSYLATLLSNKNKDIITN